MNNNSIIFLFLISFSWGIVSINAQNSTGINNSSPSKKAALDVMSTIGTGNQQGILVPRLSVSDTAILKTGITSAEKGLLFFDIDNDHYWFWNGLKWVALGKTVSAGISGTGTLNTLPIWTGASSLGLSAIKQTGAGVNASLSVGNVIPNALFGKFYVMGDANAIRGEASTTGANNIGVFGLAGAASTEAIGVQGTATGTSTLKGVQALANGAGVNTYALYATNTSTGTNSYGVYAVVSAGTNKYAGVFMGGNVGVGVSAPTSLLHVTRGTNPNSTGQPTGVFASTIYNATNAIGENGLLVKNNWRAATSTVFEVGNDLLTGAYASYLKVDGLGAVTMPLLGTGIVTATAGKLSTIAGSPVTGTGTNGNVAFWSGVNSLSSNANFYWNNTYNQLSLGTPLIGLGRLQVDNVLLNGREIKFLYSGVAHWSIINNTNGLQFGSTSSQGFATGTLDATLMTLQSGSVCINGSLFYSSLASSCSDIRYKKEIQPISRVIEKLSNLDGVYYNWRVKDFPEKQFSLGRQVGVIAQDVEKFFPEVVVTDDKGFKSVDYSKLSPILLQAIKEQQGVIDSLKSSLQNQTIQFKQLKGSIDEKDSQLKEQKTLWLKHEEEINKIKLYLGTEAKK